jgi:hypothetical protein
VLPVTKAPSALAGSIYCNGYAGFDFIGGTLGLLGSTSYALAAVLTTLYGIVILARLVIAHGGAFPARRDARDQLAIDRSPAGRLHTG